MFGSRKNDEKKARRRFWPWGRREEKTQPPETVDNTQDNVETAAEQPVVELPVEPVAEESHVEQPVVAHAEPEVTAEPVTEQPEAAELPEAVVTETEQEEVSQEAEAVVEEIQQVQETPAEPEPEPEPVQEVVAVAPQPEPEPKAEKLGFFARMKKGLSKTRAALVEGVAEIFIGKKEIDDDLLEELETRLLMADVGVEATTKIIKHLTQRVSRKELGDADALMDALKQELQGILVPADKPLVIEKQKIPFVILVVGVNGVGKTTTIGKVARKLQDEGKSVMLAAGDTFRAAAVEQLQVWGERNSIPVVAQHTGADSASVIYDAFEAAKARGIDVLIADTAGRLHTKDNLMEELKKVKRVLGKLDDSAPHETLLVLDAGTGQNALNQAKIFNEAVELTGMALTKLDGTAKGGVIFALSKQMQLPIRFLGVGEQIDDLRPFNAGEFVEALFDRKSDT